VCCNKGGQLAALGCAGAASVLAGIHIAQNRVAAPVMRKACKARYGTALETNKSA
jgi:hypothetical protein